MTTRSIPEAFHTERLLIRCPRAEDAAALHAAVRESLNELQPWMPWAHNESTVAQTTELLSQAAEDYRNGTGRLWLLLFLRDSGELVGSSGFHHLDWSIPKMEIGYWCRTSLAGRGYITEAVRGQTAFAFEHLRVERIAIRCDTDNRRSRRVAEHAGYTLEGVLRRHHRRIDGTLADEAVYSMIREEYERLSFPVIEIGTGAK